MKNKPWFPIFYMFIITAFFSAILIGFSRLTHERVLANEQLALERAVLEAFPDIEIPAASEIHALFTELFSRSPEAAGAYVYQINGELRGYAVPVEGQGFWAEIKGVMGILPDLKTIAGLAFHEQNETPGLGARITEEEFRAQFEGLAMAEPPRIIGIRPTTVTPAANEVHAITGATQTCVRLEKLINDALDDWLAKMENNKLQ